MHTKREIAAIIIGIIALIIIVAIIVFLIKLLAPAPLFIGTIILAIIVGVGWWMTVK